MNRDSYLRLKARLETIDDALHEGHLTAEERSALEAQSAELSRQLVAPWIPGDWTRRGIMVGLAASGSVGIVVGLDLLVWCWPLVPLVSPRIMGENFHFGRRREPS